jgi:hypothetical protein
MEPKGRSLAAGLIRFHRFPLGFAPPFHELVAIIEVYLHRYKIKLQYGVE